MGKTKENCSSRTLAYFHHTPVVLQLTSDFLILANVAIKATTLDLFKKIMFIKLRPT